MAEKFDNKIHFLLFAKERGFMNKQKKLLGRIIAFALSLVMVCSSFGTSSISAYAAGSADETIVIEASDTIQAEVEQEDVSGNEIPEEESGYIGEKEEEWCGPALRIDEWVLADAGLTVSDNAIISILEAQEEKYSVVSLNLAGETGVSAEEISVELWNALVGVLDSSVSSEPDWTEIRINKSGDLNADINWNFVKPYYAEKVVGTGMTWSVGAKDEGIDVSFANTEFPADETSVNIYTDENKTDYSSILSAVGSEKIITVFDENGNEVADMFGSVEEGTFEDEDVEKNSVNISFRPINKLNAEDTYTVKSTAYKGRIETYDEGNKSLRLHPGDAWLDTFTKADILAALEANEDACVDEIYIEMVDAESMVIDDEITNSALRLFRENDFEKSIVYAYRDNTDKKCTEIILINPTEDNDVTAQEVKATLTVTEENASVAVNIPEVFADRVDVYFGYDLDSEGVASLTNLFGTNHKNLEIDTDTWVDGWFDYGEDWGCGLRIHGVNNLEADSEYVIKEKVYRGTPEEWEDGYRVLRIICYDAGKEDAFSIEEIKAIVGNYDEVFFNEVFVEQPRNENNAIDSKILCETVKYLREDAEEVAVTFSFSDEAGATNWRYINPSITADAGTVSANAVIDVKAQNDVDTAYISKTGSVSFDGLEADRIDLEYIISHEVNEESNPLADTLKALFGDGNARLKAEDSNVPIDYRVDEWAVCIYVNDVESLQNNKEYALSLDEYKGMVEDDVLFIYPWHVEPYGLEYTEDLIVEILNDHAEAQEKFKRVEIGFFDAEDPDEAVVSAKIYNAAAPLIDTDVEEKDGFNNGLKFVYYEESGGVVWGFANPTSIEEDITMKHWIGFNEDGNVIMTVNMPDLSETRVSLEVVPNATEERDFLDDLMERLGDDSEDVTYALYPLVEREPLIFGWNKYGDEEDPRMQILIDGIDALINDDVYEVNKMLPGNTWIDEMYDEPDRNNLYLAPGDVGLDTFDKGDVEKYLSYYVAQKQKFDCVYIEKPYAVDEENNPENIIYKDEYNYIREKLLSENPDTSIVFVYDMSTVDIGELEDEEDDIWIQDQLRYEFINPSEMTEDLDASARFVFADNYENGEEIIRNGVDVILPETTYPENGVNVQIHADSESEAAKNFMDSLGIPEDEIIICCIMEDKETLSDTLNDTVFDWYSSGERRIYTLNIGLAENIPADTPCRIYPVQFVDPLYMTRSELLESCVKGEDLIWKSLTPDSAKITKDSKGDYYIEPLSEGMAFYGYYTLLDENTPIVEIFGRPIERKTLSMKFVNASETNPLVVEANPKNSDAFATGYLDLRFFPTGTGVDFDDLEWSCTSVTDSSVQSDCISFLDSEGTFAIKKAGEALVTVTCKSDSTLKATAKVVVKQAVEDELNDVLEKNGIDLEFGFVALAGYDKTLADIAHLLPENMKWADSTIALADYNDNPEVTFNAIYTSPIDNRSIIVPVYVYVESFSEIQLGAYLREGSVEDGAIVNEGDDITFELGVPELGDINVINEMLSLSRPEIILRTSASSSPKNILTVDNEDKNEYIFTPSASAKGKKTFTFSLDVVNTKTDKATSVAKRSMSLYVPGKPLFKWIDYVSFNDNHNENFYKVPEGSDEKVAHTSDSVIGEKGELKLIQPANNYFKITAKSLDTKVCKIVSVKTTDSEDKTKKITTIQYVVISGGRAFVQLTAADELKSAYCLEFDVIDIMPKVESSTGTIDTTKKDMSAIVEWQLKSGTGLDCSQITLSGSDSDNFMAELDVLDTDAYVTIKVKDDSRDIKPGKYKLDVSVPVMVNDEKVDTFTTKVTISVVAPKKSVTVKQTGKPNVFYDGDIGVLVFSHDIESLSITDQKSNKKCDFVIDFYIGNTCYFRLKDGGNSKNNYARLEVKAEELYKPVIIDLRLKTENKKPSLLLTNKSVSLYPNYSNTIFTTEITDKYDNHYDWKYSEGGIIEVQDAKGNWISIKEESKEVVLKNNTYVLNLSSNGDMISGSTITDKKAADTLNIRVREDSWANKTQYITLSCKIKVDPSVPKLVADKKTLILNKNDAVYTTEIAETSLRLKDNALCTGEIYERSFDVVGLDEKSAKVMDTNLAIDINDYYGDITLQARFNGKEDLQNTSYKYRVTQHQDGYADISTDITIKVVDVPPAKALSVSAKGSINVLDRYGSEITYTAKVNNINYAELSGGSYLIGPDADKFDMYEYGDNTIVVYAKEGIDYSTKQNYYVTPVFVFRNLEGSEFELVGKQQKIKVKQVEPKVTVTSPEGNVLYRDRNNELSFYIHASNNNNSQVNISRVELANYADDLNITFDSVTNKVTLSQDAVKQIIASGKTWQLKLNVYYADKAINTKPKQVTYKLVVK